MQRTADEVAGRRVRHKGAHTLDLRFIGRVLPRPLGSTPSGLRRFLQAPVRQGTLLLAALGLAMYRNAVIE